MYDTKLGVILFDQLHVIFEIYNNTIISLTSTPSMSLSTSFSLDTLLMQTKRATERMETGLFGMTFKKVQHGVKNKKVIIYNSCVPCQR
jgi:hypothetical protein